MNNGTDSRYEGDIKKLKRVLLIAILLFLALATTFAILERNRRGLEMTLRELARAKDGLARVREAAMNRKKALATLKSQLASNLYTSSPERLIYGKVDEIKSHLKPDDMTIASLEKKDGGISLPFTLKFTNPNYCDLLNTVSQLQQAVFPFTPVNSIALAQGDQNGKGVVEFTINGFVLTMERSKP